MKSSKDEIQAKDLFDLDESDDHVSDSDEEALEETDTRFSMSRLTNVFDDEDEEDEDEDEDNDSDLEEASDNDQTVQAQDQASGHADPEATLTHRDLSEKRANDRKSKKKLKNKIKALTPEELEKFEKEQQKTGVCYLSRIPQFMTPHRLRCLLKQYGDIGRMHIVPEDPRITAKRRKYTRSRRVNYIEGWVEFMDKKRAKAVASYLNTKQIGGKRKSRFYHEMWSIKYLPKIKWGTLQDQINHDKQVFYQRLRNEIAQATRENKMFIQSVEKSKMIKNIEDKKRQRGTHEPDTPEKIRRTFTQRSIVDREVDLDTIQRDATSRHLIKDRVDPSVKNVLGKIFGK